MNLKLIFTALCTLFSVPAFADHNLHLIDQDPHSGFAIYRTGKPDRADFQQLCKLGVEQMIVLSGTAAQHELKYQADCPQMKVIYNEKQNAGIALTEDFLHQFDEWVLSAKAQGKKIAFRCECGCHRTGRLAAYYQMKYQHLPVDDALVLMHAYGHLMFLHRNLWPQVRALDQYIRGEACSQGPRYCVRKFEATLAELAAQNGDPDGESDEN